MESRTIAHVGDLQNYSDLLKSNYIVKDNGVWKVQGVRGIELNTHLFDTLLFLGKLKQIEYRATSNIYKYKLQALRFDTDEKYYKQLCRFTYNRKFWGLYDIERVLGKLGYSVDTRYTDKVFPTANAAIKVKSLILTKGNFKLVIPYFSKINSLCNKGGLYKQLVQIVSKIYPLEAKYPYIVTIDPVPKRPPTVVSTMLQREWDYQFKQISDKVLVWANYEEGQYDNIR